MMFIGDQKSEKCCDLDKNIENTSEPKMSFNNHYHLIEKNSSALNIMSGIKSLVSDMNGIIIAEMVYRCMICDVIYETIPEVSIHYQTKHIDQDLPEKGSKRSTNKSSHSTNVSFLDSFQLPTDPYSDQTVESSNSQTLTFDVPSGLKTLQQQFESSSKDSPQKKKTAKSLSSNESKTKMSSHQKPKVLGHITGPTIKSGFITCEICGATKFYKYTQRRFGVYSCVGCAKFYSKYLLKPVAYKMCENLGKCNLKASECEPNGRCKACLIHKCRSKFIIDPKKLNHYRNESNNNKLKTNQKQTLSKESNNKSIKPSKPSLEFKTKGNSMSTKNKCEESPQNRINASVNANKKCKSERSQLKTNAEKISKKSTNSSGISKPTVDKTTVLVKIKKNTSKTTEVDSKRTRNQSFCRKCLASKSKDCNHFGNVSEPNKFKSMDKNRLSLKRTHCFTRSRNK